MLNVNWGGIKMSNVKLIPSITITSSAIYRLRSVIGCLFAGLLSISLMGCTESKRSAEFLFVQTAHRVTLNNSRITLHDVSPTTLFFSDRPERITGHEGTEMFVDNWSKGSNSFAKNPPNAALSIQ